MTLETFFQSGWGVFTLIVVTLWQLPWKGYALWTAARRKEAGWFILLFLVNTLAILEILYIFWIARENTNRAKKGWKWVRKRKR
jgi:hypothetical protein